MKDGADPGLNTLIFCQQRRDKLDQFDISSVVDELKEALEEVIQKEQEAVQESVERTSAAKADNSEPSDEIDPEEQERLNDLLESIAPLA